VRAGFRFQSLSVLAGRVGTGLTVESTDRVIESHRLSTWPVHQKVDVVAGYVFRDLATRCTASLQRKVELVIGSCRPSGTAGVQFTLAPVVRATGKELPSHPRLKSVVRKSPEGDDSRESSIRHLPGGQAE
jgi:hypothetical protein